MGCGSVKDAKDGSTLEKINLPSGVCALYIIPGNF